MARRPCFKLEIGYPEPLAGVDEAGCAPLAGPVVAAAIILDRDKFPRGIDDSKNLPLETREALYAKLVKVAAWGVGVASVETKGLTAGKAYHQVGLIPFAGLSDE